MRYYLKIILCTLLLGISACKTKHGADMTFVMQANDFSKSCTSLTNEISDIENNQIKSLTNKKKTKIVRNTTLFYLSLPTAFLSLLFVDFSGDETQEILIYEERITHLKQILKISKCDG